MHISKPQSCYECDTKILNSLWEPKKIVDAASNLHSILSISELFDWRLPVDIDL